jgi:chaperonin GroES
MLKPRLDYILVEPVELEITSSISVILREKAQVGIVAAVGPGKPDKKGHIRPLDVNVGDRIRFGGEDYLNYPEWQDDHTLKRYFVIQEADITGVVDA